MQQIATRICVTTVKRFMGFPYSSVLQHSVLLVGSRTWLLFAIWRLFVCVVGRMRSVERKRKSRNAWSHTENPKRGAHAREPELSDLTLTWLPRTIRRGALTCVTWKRPSRFFVLYFSCNWFRHIKISPEDVVEFLCFCFVIVESQSPHGFIQSSIFTLVDVQFVFWFCYEILRLQVAECNFRVIFQRFGNEGVRTGPSTLGTNIHFIAAFLANARVLCELKRAWYNAE